MTANQRRLSTAALTIAALGFSCAVAGAQTADSPPASVCPMRGWAENLINFQKPDAVVPTEDTKTIPTPDCNFHEWSWEAFVWATAMMNVPGSDTPVPRFMTLPTPADLLTADTAAAGEPKARPLTLASRAQVFHGAPGFSEGAGAIVEADGNMLVAQNGYPVYASVHMNRSYFNTAKKNMVATGGYMSQPADSTFDTGAAVFKATWLRLADGESAPAGTYTTQAQIPILAEKITPGLVTIEPVPGKFVTVTVALIGLHVVGSTVNHQEFLWGTFEHKLNSPQTADNTFTPSASKSDPNNYTLYKANTPFNRVNIALDPPRLRLDPNTQKLTPVTNVVLANKTGGENQPGGVANIGSLNAQSQSFLKNEKPPQSVFANYNLIGTVWMKPTSYNLKSDQTSAVGSVNLANVTAETFRQRAQNTPIGRVHNCFSCHNPTAYSFQTPPPPKLPDRLIALSHVLGVGSPYEVPNSISGVLSRVPQGQ